MTRMTDLTAERLDELHASVFRETQRVPHKATYGITLGDCLALIAMARDKQAAERERDALREAAANLVKHPLAYRAYHGDDYVHCIVCDRRPGLEDHAPDCAAMALRALVPDVGDA